VPMSLEHCNLEDRVESFSITDELIQVEESYIPKSEEDFVTLTFYIDMDVYVQCNELFSSLGTTIEEITVAFFKYCVKPENQQIIEEYMKPNADKQLKQKVFAEILDIALNEK